MLHPDTTPCAPPPPGHYRRRRVGIRRVELGRRVWAELRRHAPELELVPGGAEVPRLEPADCEGMLGAPRLGRMPDHPEFHGVVPALRDPRIHAVRVRLEDAASLGAGDSELRGGDPPELERAQRSVRADGARAEQLAEPP